MAIDGKTLGLALSGGGYRAALFALGSLWRLNDAGLLGRLDRITSVSGGSISAGLLAHRWSKLTFTDGRATNFIDEIANPLQEFCKHTIDVGAGLLGIITPFKSAGDYLVDSYEKHLFGRTLLGSLPPAGNGVPKFIIYATNMQTGRSFRFRQDMIADYMLGTCTGVNVTLATAVAASSAFPPVFSPIILETGANAAWANGTNLPGLAKLRRRIVLSDGGVYDNMGLESLVDNVDIVLVSDAGAPFGIEVDPHGDYVRQLGRVRDILIDQARALRKRWLVEDFKARRKRGAYWGIGTNIEDYQDSGSPFKDTQVTGDLAAVPTRLAEFEPQIRGRLVNWGYALCDVALRMRAEIPIARPAALPLPKWPLH
jgi:NTE family protein